MKKWILILLMCLGLAVSAFSHSGRTDATGCHTSELGVFHCH